MKKLTLLLLTLSLSVMIWGEPLTLFFTNDTHGAYLPRAVKTAAGTDSIGGYELLYNNIPHAYNNYFIKWPYLWLDAGDQQTGSVFSAYKYNDVIGGAVIETFNQMGLDAATLGNHEFDQSLENTQKLIQMAKYPFLSANIVWEKNGKPFTGKPYAIFKRGKLKIGVIGLTMTDLNEKVKAENVRDLKVLPYMEAINKYLNKLDKKTDLIILLTHIGLEADSLLATQLDDRVDIIVGGHSHDALFEPKMVNGIMILQTGAYLNNYGMMMLNVEKDRIYFPTGYTESSVTVYSSSCLGRLSLSAKLEKQRQAMKYESYSSITVLPTAKSEKYWKGQEEKKQRFMSFLHTISAQISKDMDKVIGTIPTDWLPDKYNETDASRWQAQALLAEYKDKYKADLAMINCGGIRKAIPQGDVTIRDMKEMLPFDNYIVVFSVKGSDLLKFAELNDEHKVNKPYDIVQSTMPGWVYGIKTNPTQKPWFEIANGVKLDENKTYRVVTHDYLAGQWDKYLGFKPFDVVDTGDLIYDVMVKQVELQYGAKKALTK